MSKRSKESGVEEEEYRAMKCELSLFEKSLRGSLVVPSIPMPLGYAYGSSTFKYFMSYVLRILYKRGYQRTWRDLHGVYVCPQYSITRRPTEVRRLSGASLVVLVSSTMLRMTFESAGQRICHHPEGSSSFVARQAA